TVLWKPAVALSMSATAISGLTRFLQAGRAALAAAPPKLHVYTGNQAGDADSLVSALCLSYLSSCLHRECQDSRGLAIPVMSIPRSEFEMRPETAMLWRKANVDSKDVIFADELDLHSEWAQGRLELTLTDHNASSRPSLGDRAGLEAAVTRIVDHHMDLGESSHVQGTAREVAFEEGAALVGSCCTQVAEHFLKEYKEALTLDVALLLLGVILIDTVNLDPSARRATDRDHQVVKLLFELHPELKERQSTLFQELSDAKFSPTFWSSLTAEQCLRYDYKEMSSTGKDGTKKLVGMSAVLVRLEDFLDKAAARQAMRGLLEERGLDMLAVLTFVVQPQRRRELLLMAPEQGTTTVNEAVAFLGANFDLQLEQAESVMQDLGMAGFEQHNTVASRKQVSPKLRNSNA
ncbi:unnamed protein product, partial [Chrysoparadoxa australica]